MEGIGGIELEVELGDKGEDWWLGWEGIRKDGDKVELGLWSIPKDKWAWVWVVDTIQGEGVSQLASTSSV